MSAEPPTVSRRRFLRDAALGSGAVLLGAAPTSLMAAAPSALRFPVSDHCDGRRFFNPRRHINRDWTEVMRWKLTSSPAPWPDRVAITPAAPPPAPAGPEIAATWIGHSTYLLRSPAGNVLTDPVYSERASPVGFAGPKRVHEPGIRFSDLPPLDLVVVTHDHYDHCDVATLERLARDHPRAVAVTPLNNGPILAGAGWAPERIVELDWWESHTLPGGIVAQVTPARHWSNRATGARNGRLWGGFNLRLGARSVQVVGDTGYDEFMFREIRQRCGAPDLALVPIGAYEPRWFMSEMHCNPAEAVQIHLDLGAKRSAAKHWGTFQLTDESREAPPAALAAALGTAKLSPDAFRIPQPGESLLA